MNNKFFIFLLLIGVSSLSAMITAHKTIFQQIKEFNNNPSTMKGIRVNDNKVTVLKSLIEIPKWKEFSELENINLTAQESMPTTPIIDMEKIDAWGKKHYGSTFRRDAGIFGLGVATTGICAYLWSKFKN